MMKSTIDTPWLMVLGTAQDAGVPQMNCHRPCCQWARRDHRYRRLPACLAIVDPEQHRRWMIDCTPAFPEQVERLNERSDPAWGLEGIFLTHAHMGHYMGLAHLGREVMNAQNLPVHVMRRMGEFLRSDAPWRLLVEQEHIHLRCLEANKSYKLSAKLSITPISVPHRDEISETVCFLIEGPTRFALHLPDIDAWEDWEVSIESLLERVDVAWLDGTFWDGEELGGRDMSKIPHPAVKQSIERFSALPKSQRDKIRFTHLNHSNPICNPNRLESELLKKAGFSVAEEGEMFML